MISPGDGLGCVAERQLCLGTLLRRQAACRPHAPAIVAAGRAALSYASLAGLLEDVGRQLRSLGIGPGDRVAIVLPNGPEMAACFLCVAGVATAAPLNPAYRPSEFDFYLADLRAKALIVQAGTETAATASAASAGVPVVEIRPDPARAGAFTIPGRPCGRPQPGGFAAAQDTALVLHTSGTTSRPKIVPLTHANICTSAANIASWLGLGPGDRAINVMPLFHIHGLVGALLSTLVSGGSAVCCPEFKADQFLDALETFCPTWYTAVPTIHQAVLAAATEAGRSGRRTSLRFIRSCSSALAPAVMERLEAAFGVPVVEAYGMTEAAHQMTCNPLPPGTRKPGSVGMPTGIDLGIMDEAGRLLPRGAVGEVVIRGESVTAGYENNPQANTAAFCGGWFRTGDQGRLDDEGYLYLTGRIKELINRGGEKIAPREIDEAMLTHPAVAQAIAFAVPHPTLGEQVAAAVVRKQGQSLSQADLQRHLSGLLADFKVPQRVVFVEELPKGPRGKPQRIGLAQKLGLEGSPAQTGTGGRSDPPFGPTELRLAGIWSRLLERGEFRRTDNFFECGGDSLLGARLMADIEQTFAVVLPIQVLLESATLSGLAGLIDASLSAFRRGTVPFSLRENWDSPRVVSRPILGSLVAFQTRGARPPFFMVHGHSGRSLGLRLIAPYLDADQPYYGFEARGMDGRRLPHRTIASTAADYLDELRQVQAQGPYYLGGFCAGGMISYEMAQQLIAAGQSIALLALLDTAHPRLMAAPAPLLQAARSVKLLARRLLFRMWLGARGRVPVRLGERIVNETIRREARLYCPLPYPGTITLIRSDVHFRSSDWYLGWTHTAQQGVDLHRVPGDHAYVLTPEHIGPAARQLQQCLSEAQANQQRALDSSARSAKFIRPPRTLSREASPAGRPASW